MEMHTLGVQCLQVEMVSSSGIPSEVVVMMMVWAGSIRAARVVVVDTVLSVPIASVTR